MGRATRWFRGLLGMKKDKDRGANSAAGDSRDKKRWSFGKSGKDTSPPSNVPAAKSQPGDGAWLRSYIAESEKEQNKHAIAVAAATAAAADAAVAAAQAAVAVVRLTSQGRVTPFGGGGRERSAVVLIQTVFRGFLARKALRALKGLVKLQALVRGYLVRKRATATLYSMQALIRAQVAVRSERARRSLTRENRVQSEPRARRSIERFDETRSEFHSKRLPKSVEGLGNGFGEDTTPKIVEIDTYDPPFYALSSPLPGPNSTRLALSACRNFYDPPEWAFSGDECRFSTAHSSPRFACSGKSNAPPTPAKSACGDGFFRRDSRFPNYMLNTKSFRAKLRSHSAPKQRPESAPRRKLSLNEILASRNSISSVRMQRSCAQVEEDLDY